MLRMTDAEIIVALGDSAKVADHLKVPQNTVSNWKARGIPWPKRIQVHGLARKLRVALPEGFLSTKRVS